MDERRTASKAADESDRTMPVDESSHRDHAGEPAPAAKGDHDGDATSAAKAVAEAGTPRKGLMRRRPLLIVLGVVAVSAAILGGVVWYLNVRHFEYTDDAFIDARQFAVSPKVAGYVVDVPVTDNQFVEAGAIIAQIDRRDYENALAQAEAQRKGAEDQIANLDAQLGGQQAQVVQAEAQIKQAQASLQFAQEQFDRSQALVKTGAGTVQSAQQNQSNLKTAQSDFTRAQAALIAAKKQIDVLHAQRAGAVTSLSAAKAARDQAKLNLEYATLKAAQPGHVARLTGAKGQYIQAGQNIAMFVPDPLWVTANFKETQITDMRPGQAVDITIDAFPSRHLRGHVASIQPGSGTAFSLLPAENATGNYVKVVQRIPVKIVFDEVPSDLVLGPGMSVVPSVRVRLIIAAGPRRVLHTSRCRFPA